MTSTPCNLQGSFTETLATDVRGIPRPLSYLMPTSKRGQQLPGGKRLVFADDRVEHQTIGMECGAEDADSSVLAVDMFAHADAWLYPSEGEVETRSPVIALWKPSGIVTTMAEQIKNGLLPLVQGIASSIGLPEGRLPQPVGRLDKRTTGLLLVTDNGDLTKILLARGSVPKSYVATVNKPDASDEQLRHLMAGVKIEEGRPAVALSAEVVGVEVSLRLWRGKEKRRPEVEEVEYTRYAKIRLRIAEGRKHVVRRMLAALELQVRELHREEFGGLSCTSLGLMGPGSYATVDAGKVLELLGVCGLGPAAPDLAGASSPCEEALLRRRGRAVYNALRCGRLMCRLRQGGCLDESEEMKLKAWLDEHWTLEGPCLGAFRELCPSLNVQCSCENGGFHFFSHPDVEAAEVA